ncbi:MAG: GNAT family N-acetyltransferase [Oscillospiraceae bacterium]|nr:GNAT family N-acetyltransferase [Oscillospiraceae bacterium]
MKYYKKIVGEQVYLSPINVEDVDKYVNWLNDPSVTDNLGTSWQVMSHICEKNWIEENLKNDRAYYFGIVKNDTNELIGNVGIEDINPVHRTATVGIFIGDEECRGKGYGTEAMSLVIKYGFDVLNLNNINLNVFSFNERAVKSYIKAGFKEYGRRRKANYSNGEYHDVICMDILREEFYDKQ